MAIYIENTQPDGQRQLRSGLIFSYLFTTKRGLLFVLSQLIPLIFAYWQNWNIYNVVSYYFLYNLFIVFGVIIYSIFSKQPNRPTTYFNGEKVKEVSRGCGVIVMLAWFFPILFLGVIGLPFFLLTLPTLTIILLPLYEALVYTSAQWRWAENAYNKKPTQSDLAKGFTWMYAPYLRLMALSAFSFFVIPQMLGRNNDLFPLAMLLIIALTEMYIYGLQNVPGAVPVKVSTK